MLNALLRLGRYDKPIGIVLLLFPCWWGLAYIQGLAIDIKLMILFAIGASVMRAAGCIVNDYADRKIDQQVTRTKQRPLASGEVTPRQAFGLFVVLCLIGLLILLQFPPRCWFIGIGATVLFMVYPLSKRFTRFPQIILGLAFNIGFPMAVAIFTPNVFHPGVIAGYLAGVAWTVAYDTVYAFQDIEDDQTLGIGSTAITFGSYAKPILSVLYVLMAVLLSFSCIVAGSSLFPFFMFILAVIYSLQQLQRLNLKDVSQCREFFIKNQWVGLLIFLGFLGR